MEKLLNIQEAANYLSVSKDSLRLWDKTGKLNSLKTCGGHRRYRLSDLDNFINGGIKLDKDKFDGRIFSDEEINWKDIKVGDVVLEGESNFIYRTITSIAGNSWEYFDNGYYHETKPYYCHWKVDGQKDGKLIKIIIY